MWRRAAEPYLLLFPAGVVLGVLFLGGLAAAFWQSLAAPGAGGAFAHYRAVLASHEFRSALGLTVYIAGSATVLSCIIGLGLATGLARASARWESLLARLPLVVPHTVAAYLTILWLSQSGLLARAAFHLGLIDAPQAFPPLVNDAGSFGIIVTYVWKEAPFAALMLYPSMARAANGMLDAAATLGAGPVQQWRRVILPLVAPTLGAVALIIFAYTFSAYEVPYLLGRTYPHALPVAAVDRFLSPNLADRPVAMVYNLVITAITSLAAGVYLSRVAPALDRRNGA